MSHLRNLFHQPATPHTYHAPSPSHVLQEESAAAVTSPLPELPAQEVRILPENRIIFHTDPRSPAADRFRLLRMRLKEPWSAGKLKKLLITSPLPGDGKSTITLNLATALSERGKRSVLVIEADLHHSSLSEILRINPWAGLTESLLDESTSPFSVIRRIEPLGWHLLPAGEPRTNPTELLQTPAFAHLMEKVSPSFDWILIDSPPVVPLTDALSIQQHTDASLLVVKAGSTPREAIEQSISLIGRPHIFSVVLNGVETRNHLYYRYRYYDGHGSDQED